MINISDELREKLKTCKSDVEACKMLADNGVDVEEFQKSLPDEVLNKVGGGYKDIIGDTVYCPWCKESEYDSISYQCIASLFSNIDTYRCRTCGKFFEKDWYDDGSIEMVKLDNDLNPLD